MILPRRSKGKRLISKSFLEILVVGGLLVLNVTQLCAAKIQFDIVPATATFNVEILNPPDVNPAVKSVAPVSPTEVAPTTKSSMPDFIAAVSRELAHIFTNPGSSDSSRTRPDARVDQVLNPPFSETKLVGKGEKELVALRDGDVSVELFLWTYAKAGMEVRLIDTDGSEVWFNGSSLLIWNRPDDKTFAPVVFKGNSDEGSMVLHATGDYNARENLSYSFAIKEGQKLILRTTGNPDAKSYMRASGSAF